MSQSDGSGPLSTWLCVCVCVCVCDCVKEDLLGHRIRDALRLFQITIETDVLHFRKTPLPPILSFLPPPWSLLPHVLVSIGFFVPKAEESSQKAFPLLRPRDGHEFEQTLRGGEGQGSLACCSPWSRKESDTNERLNSNNNREGTRNQRWLLRSCSSTRGV